MATIIGTLTIDQSNFYELDQDPLTSGCPGVGVGDFCIVDGYRGIWQKTGPGDSEFVRIDAWTAFVNQATSASTLTLLANSDSVMVFTGPTAGQVVQFPDATTLVNGFQYHFFNDSSQPIALQDNGGNPLYTVPPTSRVLALLASNGSANGVWTFAGFLSSADKAKLDALVTKSGRVTSGSFSGTPKTATVTFANPFPTNNYSVDLTGADVRAWSYESKLNGSFVINSNAGQALTGDVSWQAQLEGEVG